MLDSLFSMPSLVYSVPALAGTALFVVKLILLSVGAHADHGDVGGGDAHHSDSAGAFKLLSVQGVIAFAMGFGWGGLALLRTTDWSAAWVIAGAVGAGLAMAWLLGIVIRAMFELQSSGNVSIHGAVGREGSVYASVPSANAGRGQVQVIVDGKQRTYNAVTAGEELPTGTRVAVLSANDDNTITVSRA